MNLKIAILSVLTSLICLSAHAQTNSYTVIPIVNNVEDSFLVNPWGLSRPNDPNLGENQWWVSDNATGFTTLYDAGKSGINALAPLFISIPTASGTGIGSPTGTVYNGTAGPGPGVHNFTFATLDGTISNWNAGEKPSPGGTGCARCHVTSTTIKVNRSLERASSTGLTVATNRGTPTYYAANNNGRVEAYDATSFSSVRLRGRFSDPPSRATTNPMASRRSAIAFGSPFSTKFREASWLPSTPTAGSWGNWLRGHSVSRGASRRPRLISVSSVT